MRAFADVVKESVRFDFYRDGLLYYVTESGFRFTVPVTDTGTGTFLAADKGLFFMRWMRPQWQAAQAERAAMVQEATQ